MNEKRWMYLILAILTTVCISAASWLYFSEGLPKRAPLRARQVLLYVDGEQELAWTIQVPMHNIRGRGAQ